MHSIDYNINNGPAMTSGNYSLDNFTIAFDTDLIGVTDVNIVTVSANGVTCPVNNLSFSVPVIDCCPNLIVDGDFANYPYSVPPYPMPVNFQSDNIFWGNTSPVNLDCETYFGVGPSTINSIGFRLYYFIK